MPRLPTYARNEIRSGDHISPSLFLRALRCLGNANTVEEFWSASGISTLPVALDVLKKLFELGIGSEIGPGTGLSFTESDRIRCAVAAVRAGCSIEEVSSLLSWRDFEALASEVLSACGYKTTNNVRLKKPRMEIDVVGMSSGTAIVIDCKHWRRYSQSALAKFCELQVARSERLLATTKAKLIVPVILTLYTANCKFIHGVPVVPVAQFSSFVTMLEEHLESVRLISR